jgi:proteasome lid subunit RPN8/RPN11
MTRPTPGAFTVSLPDFVTPAVVDAMRDHTLAAYPEEACGLVTVSGYEPCTNISLKPTEEFLIDPSEYVGRDYLAVFHSHPDQPDCPSSADMRSQVASGKPWVIMATNGQTPLEPFAWGDTLPILPLLNRPFRHGVLDCYSIVRDWFRLERGVTLREVPRDFGWWGDGQDLYRQGFQDHGFERIDGPEDGCAFLAQVRSPRVPNHAGIYLGGGLALHHLQNRLSRREPIHQWARKSVTHWLRYVGG